MVPEKIDLVTALGTFDAAPDLILELLDFFNGSLELAYSEETRETRQVFVGQQVGTVHLICTGHRQTKEALHRLKKAMALEFPKVAVSPVHLASSNISSSQDDEAMKKLVYGLIRNLEGSRTIISSGGLKTITQRLIEAGLLSGCQGYLSIIGTGASIPKRHEHQKLAVIWTPSSQLLREKWKRGKKLNEKQVGSSFRCLSVLPLMVQRALLDSKIGATETKKEEDLAWLKRLPKADLHCHLGGCQDEELLLKLARQFLDDLRVDEARQMEIRKCFCDRLAISAISDITPDHLRSLTPDKATIHCLENLDKLFSRRPENKYLLTAVLVAGLNPQQLRLLSRDGRIDQQNHIINWPKHEHDDSLTWYMKCGDLGGSSLLQSEATLRLALRSLLQDSHNENIRYLEVRCSPGNYVQAGLLTMHKAMDCLLDEARQFMAEQPGFRVNFLIMATRHKSRADLTAHVAVAVLYSQVDHDKGPRVVGFDLAGQEKDHDPIQFQEEFMPLHRHFLNITIHAGEMADEDKIWQAIYLLHAKRIGHGLKLIDNKKMMEFVRDYNLTIEMCPSSNFQTNNFVLFPEVGSREKEIYPLQEYMRNGIEVMVNTDNRFISDTTLSREYWQAAAMTRGGLSRLQILKLIRTSFQAAFLHKDDKDKLLKEIDDEVFKLLLEDYFDETN